MKTKSESPQQQLDRFLDRFNPPITALARAAVRKLRARLPSAVQMVYDNYNALVVGFCPNERRSDGVFSIAVYPRSVALCFLQGAGLPDPDKRLNGSGTVARHIVLSDAKVLDEPAVQSLVTTAMNRARTPFDPAADGTLIIKSISAKQRPRRPAIS
jgi:hypothetical protein